MLNPLTQAPHLWDRPPYGEGVQSWKKSKLLPSLGSPGVPYHPLTYQKGVLGASETPCSPKPSLGQFRDGLVTKGSLSGKKRKEKGVREGSGGGRRGPVIACLPVLSLCTQGACWWMLLPFEE